MDTWRCRAKAYQATRNVSKSFWTSCERTGNSRAMEQDRVRLLRGDNSKLPRPPFVSITRAWTEREVQGDVFRQRGMVRLFLVARLTQGLQVEDISPPTIGFGYYMVDGDLTMLEQFVAAKTIQPVHFDYGFSETFANRHGISVKPTPDIVLQGFLHHVARTVFVFPIGQWATAVKTVRPLNTGIHSFRYRLFQVVNHLWWEPKQQEVYGPSLVVYIGQIRFLKPGEVPAPAADAIATYRAGDRHG